MTYRAPLYSNDSNAHTGGADCPCRPKRVHVLANGVEVWAHRDAAGHFAPAHVLLWAIGEAAHADDD